MCMTLCWYICTYLASYAMHWVLLQGAYGLLTAPLLQNSSMDQDLEGAAPATALSPSGPESTTTHHLQPPPVHQSQRHGPLCEEHHLVLRQQQAQQQQQVQPQHESHSVASCGSTRAKAGRRRRVQHREKLCSSVLYVDGSPWEVVQQVVLPVLILLMGLGFSIAALYVALLPWLDRGKQ